MKPSLAAGLAVSIRFTSFVAVFALFIPLFWQEASSPYLYVNQEARLRKLLTRYTIASISFIITVFVCHILDTLCYFSVSGAFQGWSNLGWGVDVMVLPTWLKSAVFNAGEGGAELYGVHPWYWYYAVGVPAVLGVWVVPYVLQVVATPEPEGGA